MALQAPPDQLEVAGWAEALTVYRETAGRTGTPARPGTPARSGRRARPERPVRTRSRRPGWIPVPLGTRFAAAGAAAIALLGGGVAASYADSLPGVLQNFAHETLGAPGSQARPTPDASGRPVGPSVTGSATYGLCNAYLHAEAHGSASQQAVAFRNLEHAAGGADKVAMFCASVPHPGSASPASPPGRRVGQTRSTSGPGHHGKPTAPPGKPTAAPGRPTTPPGKPTATPGSGNGKGQGTGNASASAKASTNGKGNGGGTSTGNANGNRSGN